MSLKKIFAVLFLFTASCACVAATTPPSSILSVAEPIPKEEQPSPNLPPSDPTLSEPNPQSGPPPLPSSQEMTTSYESSFIRMLVTLLGLVFLVFATFWILRRMGKGKFKMGSSRSINVLEKRALSPKSMLYIVEIGNKKVLISESQVEVRTLTSFDDSSETTE